MDFTFNGVRPNYIYFNGNSLNRVTCNGVTVWQKGPLDSLKFTAVNNVSIELQNYDNNAPDIKYSFDCENWVQWDYSAISISAGDVVYFKGNNPSGFSSSTTKYSNFTFSSYVNISGNVMSLIDDGDCNTYVIPCDYCFYKLFYGSGARNISVGLLPATTLTTMCYGDMFAWCRTLISIPSGLLPATTLAGNCYDGMFRYTAITSIPSGFLPATTLAGWCYNAMFWGCHSLTTVPSNLLPATTLVARCYEQMFAFTSLVTAPKLPATTLATYCYDGMFSSCTSLTTAPALPAKTLAYACYSDMFAGCTSLINAPALPATTLAARCYVTMFQHCTSLTTAPELPAKTLAEACYLQMFKGCTNLNYIKCLATNKSATDCTYRWVADVAATGTFVKAASMTGWTRSTNGIPSGWTVQNA